MVKPRIHICSSCNESAQSEDKQGKYVARQQQDKEINCRAPWENASGIIHYCLIRGKAIKVPLSVFNICEGEFGLESTEIICK